MKTLRLQEKEKDFRRGGQPLKLVMLVRLFQGNGGRLREKVDREMAEAERSVGKEGLLGAYLLVTIR